MTTTTPTTKTTKSNRIKRTGRMAAAVGTAAIAVLTLAGPAAAQDTSDPAEDRAARIELACSRVPNITELTENAIERIGGDAETWGSLAWLDVRIDNATERGRDDLATVLENRRAVRASLVPVLETRLDRLDELATLCEDAGFGS